MKNTIFVTVNVCDIFYEFGRINVFQGQIKRPFIYRYMLLVLVIPKTSKFGFAVSARTQGVGVETVVTFISG